MVQAASRIGVMVVSVDGLDALISLANVSMQSLPCPCIGWSFHGRRNVAALSMRRVLRGWCVFISPLQVRAPVVDFTAWVDISKGTSLVSSFVRSLNGVYDRVGSGIRYGMLRTLLVVGDPHRPFLIFWWARLDSTSAHVCGYPCLPLVLTPPPVINQRPSNRQYRVLVRWIPPMSKGPAQDSQNLRILNRHLLF